MQEQYKKLIKLAVIAGVVYLGFRYLLPLFLPFVLAYSIAVILRKPVRFLWCRLKIKPAVGGAFLLVLFLFGAGGGIVYAVKILLQQFAEFVGNYDVYAMEWDGYFERICFYFDSLFHLEEGKTFSALSDNLERIVLFFREELIPFLTRNSVKAAVSVTELVASVIVVFVAVLLFLSDMLGDGAAFSKKHCRGRKKVGKNVQEETEAGIFSFIKEEWHQVKQELSGAGIAYVKTQVILILLVSTICTMGFLLIKNSYAMLFGVAIGLFDAFPVLGSGLILIPWAVISFIRGKAFAGAVLLTLFGICQFMREYLEPKLLGGKMGMRPVQSLMAVYVGYELFGVSGLFLGPFGLVLIKSIWKVTGSEN